MEKVKISREKMYMLDSLKMGKGKVLGKSIIARVCSMKVSSEMGRNKEKERSIFSTETSMKATI